MRERSGSSADYRYGFNGKENDNEVMGDNNWQDYGMRMYNTLIGRFPNVDPLAPSYPELTPFQFANNTPIVAVDLDGLESWYTNTGEISEYGGPLSKEFREKNKLYATPPNTFENSIRYKPAIKKIDSNNTSVGKSGISLNDKVPFVSQFTLERPNVACCRASQKTLKDFGLDNSGLKSSRIIVAKEDLNKTKLEVTKNAKNGVDYINQQLESGNPVMVGVDHTLGKGQSDGTASDHYVVITGRGYDTSKKQSYFTFYEVGTSHEDKGKSDKNRLYIQNDNSIKGTNYSGKRKFTVIEVRKNNTKK